VAADPPVDLQGAFGCDVAGITAAVCSGSGGSIAVMRARARPDLRATVMPRPTALGALEAAGVEFIDENGGGPGVRLRELGHPRLAGAGAAMWVMPPS
jgi:hypothetical protein